MESVKERVRAFVSHKRLTMKEFERICGLSNGYVASMRQSIGREKLENIIRAFPDLNREWLLYGEGSMLRTSAPSVSQHNGDNSPNVFQQVGEPNSTDANKLYEIIAEKDRQIDRLLSIMEAHVCR